MTTFDERKDSFEKKFALDQDLKFRAEARRNRLLGLWAAEKLGMTGEEAAAYAKQVVTADFDVSGDGDVLLKVSRDLANAGISEQQVQAKMLDLLAVAVEQIRAGQ